MNNSGQIRLVKNPEIDRKKWDACLEKSPLGKLYARSWFLDIVAEGWQALIFEDYDFIMPLPVRSKYRIKYVFQPAFCQQLGIYPNPPVEIQKQFAQILKKSFLLVSYQLNFLNNVSAFEGFRVREKTNFVLPLDKSYDQLFHSYANHTKRNLKTSSGYNVEIKNGLFTIDDLVEKNRESGPLLPESVYQILRRLLSGSATLGKAKIYEAYTPDNRLCAAAFFVLDGNRIYYLNSFSDNLGRKNMAMYAIINQVIKEFAGTGFIFDFEGSVIEGIAWFFKGFGAQAEKYFYIYSNRIPVVRKFMKKK